MYPWRFSEMGGTIIHPFIDGFSIVNKPFWGFPIYGNPHTYIIYIYIHQDRMIHNFGHFGVYHSFGHTQISH